MKTLLNEAIKTYGEETQLNVAIEELSELIKEICKHKRHRENRAAIIEEMADCYIMLEQMMLIFDVQEDEINGEMNKKLNRLKMRIEYDKEFKGGDSNDHERSIPQIIS